jgi:hypothetical protein
MRLILVTDRTFGSRMASSAELSTQQVARPFCEPRWSKGGPRSVPTPLTASHHLHNMAQATDYKITAAGFAWFSRHRVMLRISQAMLQAYGACLTHELLQHLLKCNQYTKDRSTYYGGLKVGSVAGRASPPGSCNYVSTSDLLTAFEVLRRCRRLQSFATEWCNLSGSPPVLRPLVELSACSRGNQFDSLTPATGPAAGYLDATEQSRWSEPPP